MLAVGLRLLARPGLPVANRGVELADASLHAYTITADVIEFYFCPGDGALCLTHGLGNEGLVVFDSLPSYQPVACQK